MRSCSNGILSQAKSNTNELEFWSLYGEQLLLKYLLRANSRIMVVNVKHKRRYCRISNCNKIVKSQGLCQRHGAKTRKCKLVGCEKQAQGNFDGMCKVHFKQTKKELIAKPITEEDLSPEPVGQSVYDYILPQSISWSSSVDAMPLIKHLKDGFDRKKPTGWHRNEERRSRGLPPVPNPAVQLETWERELVWMEICLLSGCPKSSFRHLARSWGRDKGFHTVLAQFICERRGDVERKKRLKVDSLSTQNRCRSPLEFSHCGDDIPIVLDLDDAELDIFGTFDLHSSEEVNDPNLNLTFASDFSTLDKSGALSSNRPHPERRETHTTQLSIFPSKQHRLQSQSTAPICHGDAQGGMSPHSFNARLHQCHFIA